MFKLSLTTTLIFCPTFANLYAKIKPILPSKKEFLFLKTTKCNHFPSFKLNNLSKPLNWLEMSLHESYLKMIHWFRQLSAHQPVRQKLLPLWVGAIALTAGVGLLCSKLSKKTKSNAPSVQAGSHGLTAHPEYRASNTQAESDQPTAHSECRGSNIHSGSNQPTAHSECGESNTQGGSDRPTAHLEYRASDVQSGSNQPTAHSECRESNTQGGSGRPTAHPEYRASNAQSGSNQPTAHSACRESNTQFSQLSENNVLVEHFLIQKINKNPLAAFAVIATTVEKTQTMVEFFENKPASEAILKFYTEQLDSILPSSNSITRKKFFKAEGLENINFFQKLFLDLGKKDCSLMTALIYYGYELSKIDKKLCTCFTKILLQKSSEYGLFAEEESQKYGLFSEGEQIIKQFAEDPYSNCPFYAAAHGGWKYLFDITLNEHLWQNDSLIKARLVRCQYGCAFRGARLKRLQKERLKEQIDNPLIESSRREELASFYEALLQILGQFKN